MFCCVLYHFGAFGTVKLPYETRGKTFRTREIVHATKSSRIFFVTNAPDPPHWTLNSCFWCVSYHLDAFGTVRLPYETQCKTGVVQKFVPRSRIGIFRNERTRSIPLDPKLTFWCISYYLGAFGTVWLPYETRCKTGRTSAKVCATQLHWNFSQRKHSIHPIGP